MARLIKIWKYALGSFSDEKTEQYDNYIVLVRTIILLTYFTTNIFIVAGVIRHWDDGQSGPSPRALINGRAMISTSKENV
tara:strand:+ start:204 stop:443 length:240 start_codon:yes stop_codon:yes gene_type:complete